MSSTTFETAWIRPLAAPYLRGFRPVAQCSSLRGFWFIRTASRSARKAASEPGAPPFVSATGFFVGYLLDAELYPALDASPQECLVFAFVYPLGSPLHRRLVVGDESLLRRTFGYIRWLTHRPPRFEFHSAAMPALVRHRSMRDWPGSKREHYSRNFFIETLAWLVRSGLVRKLREESGVNS